MLLRLHGAVTVADVAAAYRNTLQLDQAFAIANLGQININKLEVFRPG
jgi:hypothetical protein